MALVMVDPVVALSAVAGVKPATVRQWIARGHIVRLPGGGFDPDTLDDWLGRRDTRKIRVKVA